MNTTDNRKLDEQAMELMEDIEKLPQQLREWLYIAACDPEPEYQAMMQTVTEESEREWLVEIRAIFADAREAFS